MSKIYRIFYHNNGDAGQKFYMSVIAHDPKEALQLIRDKLTKDIIRDKVIVVGNKVTELNKEFRVK